MSENNNAIANLIEFDDVWLVRLYVPSSTLRTISGREVVGVQPNASNPKRTDLTFKKDQWLDKGFYVEVPKTEGIYNLTAWSADRDSGEKPESMQVRVVQNADDTFSISKMGYKEVLDTFGVNTEQSTDEQLTAKRGVLV
jgi:hypothetical protein